MKKTAVIYARYSSDNQTEQSIEGQLRVCEEYAKTHEMLILGTYIDRAMTGTNDNRPDFQKMIKDSKKKKWEYVLVYKLDRFSRDKYEATIHKHTLKENGVKLVSAMENIPDTPEGIILESLLEGMNMYFSAELSQKVKRGMKESRRKGLYTGGGLPYGYKVNNKKIVIDEDKAEVVKYIYEQYSLGVYVKDIRDSLTLKGILNFGKPFAMNTLYGILANERYSGVYRHGEEIIDNMFPRIISEELFKKVRSIVAKNKVGTRSVKVRYLLRHKLTCGYCGEPISADTGTARNGKVIRYYKCLGRKKRKNNCQKSMFKKEELEKLVIDSIISELSKPETMDSIVNGLLEKQEQEIKVNSTLNNLIRVKTNTELALNNLMEAIEHGVYSNTTTKRLKDLESKIEELDKEIVVEKSKTAVRYSAKEIREYYTRILAFNPEMLINFVVNEIVLYDDSITIKFNTPIKTSPDSNQDLFFVQKYVRANNIRFELKMCV